MAQMIRKGVDPFFKPPKRRAEKKPAYLTWVRTLPCCVTGQYGVEAAHTSFPSPMHGHYGRGRGTKAPDLFALPMRSEIHSSSHSGNEREFWAEAGVNPHELALVLFALFSMYDPDEATERATARIRQGIQEAKANG